MTVNLTGEEQKHRSQDSEVVRAVAEYHNAHKSRWQKAGAQFNVVQEGIPDDHVSNVYVGIARMMIESGVASMTEGEPSFSFEPVGPTDHKKVILWESLTKHNLNKCNFHAHLRRWIVDLHVFGTSPLEVFCELPQRTRRFEKPDGTIQSKIVRDFRRAKVGIRHVPIWYTMRSPNVVDPDDVPVAVKQEHLTRNQFVQLYMNAVLRNGKPKYKNIDQMPLGTHYRITTLYDEIQDRFVKYVIPYGTAVEGDVQPPEDAELGIPIFDKPLSLYRYTDESTGASVSGGLNVPGMTPLCFGTFAEQYDRDYRTHSVYGMGIPQMIEGTDSIAQAMMNMTVDNMRLKNTVPISYRPFDGVSGLDLDIGAMYSGMLIDGEITPSPVGVADLTSNQVLWEWINEIAIYLTGINYKQLVGDDMKTAFQAGLRVRQNNQRALARIKALETGALKRAGMLLLSAGLSETTVEEWEEITEEQAKDIADQISAGQMTGEDFKEEDGKKMRKVPFYIPVEGRRFTEDFTKSKRRRLDLTSDPTKNTLQEIENDGDSKISWVPAVKEYLYPTGSIESILQFDVRVDGKKMLQDLKVQDMEIMQRAADYFRTRLAETAGTEQEPNIDMKKFDEEMLKFASIDPEKMKKDTQENGKMAQMMEAALHELEANYQSPSPTSDVSASPPPASPDPLAPPIDGGTNIRPPIALERTAAGTI